MSPECKAFSQARVPNWGRMDPDKQRAVEDRGIRYMYLCARVAEHQEVSRGRYFVLEQPSGASLWDLEPLRVVASLPGVLKLSFDQCEFGLDV
eukprot:7727197-Pyramimonas_sp.AAC.1